MDKETKDFNRDILAYFLEDYSNTSDPNEMIFIGDIYYELGTQEDYYQASCWYGKAIAILECTKGEILNSTSEVVSATKFKLGILYKNGYGVFKDDSLAYSFFKEAAEYGNAKAMFQLGQMYELGEGCTKNYGIALTYYKKSAQRENTQALLKLAILYYEGKIVSQDKNKAYTFFLKAKNTYGIKVSDLNEKYLEICLSATQRGNVNAMFDVAEFYTYGCKGVEKNPEYAVQYLSRVVLKIKPHVTLDAFNGKRTSIFRDISDED